jgi:hypothetical protein
MPATGPNGKYLNRPLPFSLHGLSSCGKGGIHARFSLPKPGLRVRIKTQNFRKPPVLVRPKSKLACRNPGANFGEFGVA